MHQKWLQALSVGTDASFHSSLFFLRVNAYHDDAIFPALCWCVCCRRRRFCRRCSYKGGSCLFLGFLQCSWGGKAGWDVHGRGVGSRWLASQHATPATKHMEHMPEPYTLQLGREAA